MERQEIWIQAHRVASSREQRLILERERESRVVASVVVSKARRREQSLSPQQGEVIVPAPGVETAHQRQPSLPAC
jgi:hypothetical protein